MRRLSKYVLSGVSGLAMCASVQAADLVIGVPNWVSVNAMAHIAKVVLEDNLGIEVELQNATNPIVFEAMDKGTMHVHPEVWLPNQQNLYETYVEQKGTVVKAPNSVTSFQGMCVTDMTAEEHGVTQITDLTDPEKAKIFDSDGDGRGEIWIGATGWASTNVEKIRAKSYGFDQTLELVEMDETLALAKLDAAVAQNRPVVTICWTPHHMFGLHDLTVLKEPAHDPEKWNVIQPTDDRGLAEQVERTGGLGRHQPAYPLRQGARDRPAAGGADSEQPESGHRPGEQHGLRSRGREAGPTRVRTSLGGGERRPGG